MRSNAGAGVGVTPRGRGSTAEQRDGGLSLTPQKDFPHRLTTTNDVGNVPQRQGVPDHPVLNCSSPLICIGSPESPGPVLQYLTLCCGGKRPPNSTAWERPGSGRLAIVCSEQTFHSPPQDYPPLSPRCHPPELTLSNKKQVTPKIWRWTPRGVGGVNRGWWGAV